MTMMMVLINKQIQYNTTSQTAQLFKNKLRYQNMLCLTLKLLNF